MIEPNAHIVGIFVTAQSGSPPVPVSHAEAVVGRGLVGDRYWSGDGTWSRPGLWSAVTFIASEALERLRREGYSLSDGDLRRNVVTAGVSLMELTGREFQVGDAVFRGIRACDPCGYLERHLRLPGLKRAVGSDGGLRCEVIHGGRFEVGNPMLAEHVKLN